MNESAEHGGNFFRAIGLDFRTLSRSREVIGADVLDAWFDPSPRVLAALREYLPFLLRTSPPTYAEGLVETIAEVRGLDAASILPGAGSSSLIFACLPALIEQGARVLLLDPTYSEYSHFARHHLGASVASYRLAPECGFAICTGDFVRATLEIAPAAVLLVNPNSPTGVHWPRREALRWLDRIPESTLVWLDETYVEYAGAGESLESETARRPNLIVLKSMSKVYALSGLRVAYLVAPAVLRRRLARLIPPWPVGLAAQVAAVEALRDPQYYAARYAETHQLRREAFLRLSAIPGLRVHPSQSNFYLVETDHAAALAERLRAMNIFVRQFDGSSGILDSRYLRIAVKGDGRVEQALACAFYELHNQVGGNRAGVPGHPPPEP